MFDDTIKTVMELWWLWLLLSFIFASYVMGGGIMEEGRKKRGITPERSLSWMVNITGVAMVLSIVASIASIGLWVAKSMNFLVI